MICFRSELDISLEQFQPEDVLKIPKQIMNNKRVLTFQNAWFTKFKWLHFDANLGAILCHICSQAKQLGIVELAEKGDGAFCSKGFSKNWTKALERFSLHEKSHFHQLASQSLKYLKI